jgi:hypothetical protein
MISHPQVPWLLSPRRPGARQRCILLGHSDNAKYWFRRVGTHGVYEPLRAEAARLAAAMPHPAAAFLTSQPSWDPFAFVDLCEAVEAQRVPCGPLCLQVQRAEWDLLFDYSHRHATGRS